MTYFPVPFFMSSAGYAMHLATTYRTETHLGSERPDAWRVAVNDVKLETVVYVHDDPLASLDDFTRDTGRPMVPATWVFGPRRIVERGAMALGVEEQKLLRIKKVPTTALDDNVHFLPARSELGQRGGARAVDEGRPRAGLQGARATTTRTSRRRSHAAKGDLDYGNGARAASRSPPRASSARRSSSRASRRRVATIDLTKPEGVAWFQDLLRRALALGYDGWMHDFGEYVRRPWKFGDGRTGEAVHNEFPVLSAKAAHDLLVKEKPDDFLFYVRSGYTGTQQYVPGVWSGDPEATFDETQGLIANLRAGLNLGLSGVPIWGSDIAGFKCITDFPRDKEVYLRWAEVGAVSPMMMDETACSNPLGRREKWHLWDDQETIDVYGGLARLHTRLAPYFEVLAREAHATGVPIMRHPFLYHPREPEAWASDSSFYLGPSLFTSPVVQRGATTKETWLPPGKWVDLADLVVYDGGKRSTIPAPLAKLPLLVKDGGIVPMLDASIETLAPATDPSVVTMAKVADRLDVTVALSRGKEARIVLADGTELVARRKVGGRRRERLRRRSRRAARDVRRHGAPIRAACWPARRGWSRASASRRRSAPRVDVAHDDIELSAHGPLARRIRWDVLRLH